MVKETLLREMLRFLQLPIGRVRVHLTEYCRGIARTWTAPGLQVPVGLKTSSPISALLHASISCGSPSVISKPFFTSIYFFVHLPSANTTSIIFSDWLFHTSASAWQLWRKTFWTGSSFSVMGQVCNFHKKNRSSCRLLVNSLDKKKELRSVRHALFLNFQ